jgi:hypothetical protein
MDYDEIVESLYNLSPNELRQVAYEALLITDGPAYVNTDGNLPTWRGRNAIHELGWVVPSPLPKGPPERQYPDDYCLKTTGGYGACTLRPDHEDKCEDAHGNKFSGGRRM